MTNAFARMHARLHANPHFGVDGEYRRPPFTWRAVRLLRAQPSEEIGTVRSRALVVDILATDVGEAPAHGDQVRIGTTVHTVEDAEPDDLGHSYRLTLSEPAEE